MLQSFTELGNKLYLSPIIDLFNGEIVSFDLSERPVIQPNHQNAKEKNHSEK